MSRYPAPQQLTEEILELAAHHDFDLAAVAPVEQLPAALRLEEWLSRGMHGTMGWMAHNIERRADPSRLLPGARSVLIVAMSYWTGDEAAHDSDRGCISRYAWGDEYHRILGERLESLWAAIGELLPGVQGRWYVDTGPVLEKAWAERAGSLFMLGELFTDLPLPVDSAAKDRCGSCSACLPACPTGAITAPYQLDARRCISYLTIEYHGSIPEALRAAIGNRIFGCDDCQLVCPWNKFARVAAEPDFRVRHGLDASDLVGLFGWSEAEYLERTEGSALRRLGYRRWLRNIAVALGNAPGSEEVIAALASRRDDPDANVREHVHWALTRQGIKPARD